MTYSNSFKQKASSNSKNEDSDHENIEEVPQGQTSESTNTVTTPSGHKPHPAGEEVSSETKEANKKTEGAETVNYTFRSHLTDIGIHCQLRSTQPNLTEQTSCEGDLVSVSTRRS